jgi:hypothetical protein
MWKMKPTTGWQYSATDFQDRQPAEMAMLLRNLSHYFAQLQVAKSHKSIEALYLLRAESGIVLISQSGLETNLVDSYAYAFPNEAEKTLYLLNVGKASDKNADMEYCKNFVFYLANSGM